MPTHSSEIKVRLLRAKNCLKQSFRKKVLFLPAERDLAATKKWLAQRGIKVSTIRALHATRPGRHTGVMEFVVNLEQAAELVQLETKLLKYLGIAEETAYLKVDKVLLSTYVSTERSDSSLQTPIGWAAHPAQVLLYRARPDGRDDSWQHNWVEMIRAIASKNNCYESEVFTCTRIACVSVRAMSVDGMNGLSSDRWRRRFGIMFSVAQYCSGHGLP